MPAFAGARYYEGEIHLSQRDDAAKTARFVRAASVELDRAYRLAGLILSDAHEAQDATQDALERAWRAQRSLRDPDEFQPWFDRILLNVCRDRLRRRRRLTFVPLEGAEARATPRDAFDAVDDRDLVVRAMRDLDGDGRILLILHYGSDLTLDGVAERLGWPVGTVKSRLHRALEHVRSRVSVGTDEDADR